MWASKDDAWVKEVAGHGWWRGEMNDARLLELVDGMLEERLADSERAELAEMLQASSSARDVYWELVLQDSLLRDLVRESAGRDMARMACAEPVAEPVVAKSDAEASRVESGRSRRAIVAGGLLLLASLCGTLGVLFHVATSKTLAPPRESVALLRSLSGDVWLVEANQVAVKASSGQRFAAGDAVQVRAGGTADVELVDGSRAALSADSLLRFGSDAAPHALHLERGGAEIEAAPQAPDRPLVITTGQARLTVLGTRFRLYAGGDDSRVELEEGKVRFERQADGESIEVTAGQYAVATADDQASEPLLARPLEAQWRLRQTFLRAGERVVFSHDGTQLATATHARLKLWDPASGELRQVLSISARYDRLAFTPSDAALVALDEAGHAMFWPVGAQGARESEVPREQGRLRRCAVSHDGRWFAQTTSADGRHLPFGPIDDAGTFLPERSLPMKAGSVAIAGTVTGPRVVASAWDGTTVLWDARAGRELFRHRFDLQLHVMELTDDGRLLAGYGNRAGLVVVDTHTGEQLALWPAGSVHVNWLRFSRDGRTLFGAMADGVVRAWSASDGRPLLTLATGDSQLASLDVSADGRWLAVAGDHGRVTLWQNDQETAE